jgi:AcrR family transcriptional regulator
MMDRSARHRLRLLEGMAAALVLKGYAAVTIADVVAEAGVSKRTFYEHFGSKESCLLACYQELAAGLISTVRRQASASGLTGPEAVRQLLETYLAALDAAGPTAPTLLIEVQRAGPQGRRAYRENNLTVARFICELSADSNEPADLGGLDLNQSIALLGGVNELVLGHAEDRPDVPFSELSASVLRFTDAVIGAALVRSA